MSKRVFESLCRVGVGCIIVFCAENIVNTAFYALLGVGSISSGFIYVYNKLIGAI